MPAASAGMTQFKSTPRSDGAQRDRHRGRRCLVLRWLVLRHHEADNFSALKRSASVGWAKARSAVPTSTQAASQHGGTLRFAHPTLAIPPYALKFKWSLAISYETLCLA